MKKIISVFTATMMAATSIVSVSALAVNFPVSNEYTLSTSTVESNIVVDDITVPAGSLAVTVNISNNTGFSNKSVKFNLGSASVITDKNGIPVVDNGYVFENPIFGAAVNNDVMMIAASSLETSVVDGDMFTFYVNANSTDISIIDVDTKVEVNMIEPMAGRPYYTIGDVDNNGYIDASDASYISMAISKYEDIKYDDVLPVSTANANLTYYFPYHTPKKAEAADSNENGNITEIDARFVMNYYAEMSSGGEIDITTMGYCGERRYYND